MAKIAIIQTGGKQYIAAEGAVLTVESLESKDGKVTFDSVLLTDDGSKTVVGTPQIAGAKVTAEVVEEGRDDKVTVIRYRPKSRYFKKRGHRQPYTTVKILSV